MLSLKFTKEQLDNNKGGSGLDIRVPGFVCNPAAPDDPQIFIEYYEGQLRVCVWNGKQDPEVITLEPFSGNYDYLHELFSEFKSNIDNIGEWEFELKKCDEQTTKPSGCKIDYMIQFVHKKSKKAIVVNPVELWGDLWDDEKAGIEQCNHIDVMLVCYGDDSQYDFTGWEKHPMSETGIVDDERYIYSKFIPFVWTGERETDLLNFVEFAAELVRESEEKYGELLTFGGPVKEWMETEKDKVEVDEVEVDEDRETAHYAYIDEVLGLPGQLPPFKDRKTELPAKIGEWELFVNNDRSGTYIEWAYKGNRENPVYVNPSELWHECEMNKIGACLIASEDDSAHETDGERDYDKCEPFEWTYNRTIDRNEFIRHTKKFLDEVEEKHMDILLLHIDDMPA